MRTVKGVRSDSVVFRHREIGHVASPPRSKRDIPSGIVGSTPALSAIKFGSVAECVKAAVLKTDVTG
jgi:hypothetical protein